MATVRGSCSAAGPMAAITSTRSNREKKNGPFPERGPDEGYLVGARNVDPVNGGGDWIVTRPDHWIFSDTGMKAGDRIPGLVGWEYHGDPPADLPDWRSWLRGRRCPAECGPQHWTATIYPGPKKNFVFNASTIFWAQGLSDPPGHTLPWSHWTRPHGPDDASSRSLTTCCGGRPGDSYPPVECGEGSSRIGIVAAPGKLP